MYRTIVIMAAFLTGAFNAHAIGQEKKADEDETVKKWVDIARALQKQAGPLVGQQSEQEFKLISEIRDPKNTFDDLLKYAKELTKNTSDDETKKVLIWYIAALETTARKKKDRENEKNEIKKLIYSLKDRSDFRDFAPDDPESPAAKLVAIGQMAVPYLIDEIDNNELTRCISPEVSTNRAVLRPLYVLRIGDCARGILKKITGQRFGEPCYVHDPKATMSPKEVREQATKWWDDQKKK